MKIGNLIVDVVRKDIKNLYIKIYPPNGQIRIISPRIIDDATIKKFVAAKQKWIEKKQHKYQTQPALSSREYKSGEIHYYKGDRFLLNVIYQQASPKVIIRDNYLDVYVKYGSIKEKREQVLISWYRQQLKAELPHLIAKWERVIGVKTNDWGVKRMKTRWGTCNTTAKRIWLNLELIKKPHECLEYVIVHELVHLLEANHCDRFYAYMTQFMPEWKTYEKQLIRNN